MSSAPVPFLPRARRVTLAASVIGLLLAAGFSFLLPLQYSSGMRLLITQASTESLDPYTALKATDRIASSLSELVYTSTFYDNVMAKANGFNANYFSTNEGAKRKEWRDAVQTSMTAGTGIMAVTVNHTSRAQARILVQAVSNELVTLAPAYFGTGVRVTVIDAPLDSPGFAKPNFVSNALFGLLVGFLLGVGWSLLRLPSREVLNGK